MPKLGLRKNSLIALPESFVDVQALQVLVLANNLPATLPESFRDLGRFCQKLRLMNNSLTARPAPWSSWRTL